MQLNPTKSKTTIISDLKPQPGPQTKFLSTSANIAIYGGAAGGGKTFGLLLEPLRHYYNKSFSAVVFRRTSTDIRKMGALWDTSVEAYAPTGAEPIESRLLWGFKSGMSVQMAHMEYEKDKLSWQGAQIPLIAFDELTHFSESQFFYMMSRNRSMSGVKGYIRATCNPDPDSWVKRFIQWWLDPIIGLPIPERSGVLRWFVRVQDSFVWADTAEELTTQFKSEIESGSIGIPKSVTFIPSKVDDNKILLAKDPAYKSNLQALSRVDREQLLNGNWNVRPSAGMYFREHYFEVVDAVPADIKMRVRFWDKASTEKTESNDPDATAGVLMSKDSRGIFYIEHVEHFFYSPHKVEQAIKNTASKDGVHTWVGGAQDPGSAGKFEAAHYARQLAGYKIKSYPATKDKITMASPFSAQCEAGNVKIVRGDWNKMFLTQLEAFPEAKHDDMVDASSGAFMMLTDKQFAEPKVIFL